MNRNEFENGLKSKMGEQPFMPSEDMWLKLHADLQKQHKPKKRNLLFLAPAKIAAGLLFIAMGAGTLYFGNKKEDTAGQTVASNGSPIRSTTPAASIKTGQQPETTITSALSPVKAPDTKLPKAALQQQQPANTVIPNEPFVPAQIAHVKENDPAPVKNKEQGTKPAVTEPVYPEPGMPYYYAGNDKGQAAAFRIGLAANVGSSTVSNVSYQVGVTGRSDLSNTFFVEAGLTLAANNVNTSNQYTFTGVAVSNDGFTNAAEKSSTNIKADYARNIISLGFTPSIGIKATKQLSFSTGAALNRNLNPTLDLSNGNEIESAALTNNIITASQKVADWDLGLTCNAAYKVTRQLSVNVNYRQGLTDYLQQGNKQLKNSGVQLGLKYVFGK